MALTLFSRLKNKSNEQYELWNFINEMNSFLLDILYFICWLCLCLSLLIIEYLYKNIKKKRLLYRKELEMRLTLIQMFKKTVPGHIFRGKRRLVKPVSKRAMETLIREYEVQEANMLLLRHPYLTSKESEGHAKELNKHEEFINKWRNEIIKNKMKPHITLEDRLLHLKVKEAWD